MVSSKAIQLTDQIKQIINAFRQANLTEIFDIYKNNVLEQKQYFSNNYAQMLERNPSLKCMFKSCFDHLNNELVVSAECLVKSINAIKINMLELVSVNGREHISNAINGIIEHANQYINLMNKYHNSCIEFNEKMTQLMAYPKHFWKLFNDNFNNDIMAPCLNIPDLTKYKLVSYSDLEEHTLSSYCTECSVIWIMKDSHGHVIAVRTFLNNFKYSCVNVVVPNRPSS